MNITDKRPEYRPFFFSDIAVGTLFSPANNADLICMKTTWHVWGVTVLNSVDLSTGILHGFTQDDEVVPIDSYEFNIF